MSHFFLSLKFLATRFKAAGNHFTAEPGASTPARRTNLCPWRPWSTGRHASALLLAGLWSAPAALAIPRMDPQAPTQKVAPGPLPKPLPPAGGPSLPGTVPSASANAAPANAASPAGEWVLPTLRVPYAPLKPRLEAAADDPAWALAGTIGALVPSIVPGGQSPPVAATRVKALWDTDYLYVRFEATDTDIVTPFTARDANHYMGDVAEIFLDVVGDGRHYCEFQLSARGGLLDQYIVLSAEPRTDAYGCLLNDVRARDFWVNTAWNCDGLKTATRVLQADQPGTAPGTTPTGWIAEMALPARAVLTRLGQTQFAPATLRANFLRYDWPQDPITGKRNLVPANWSPVLSGSPHKSAARMGFLQLEPPAVAPGAAAP